MSALVRFEKVATEDGSVRYLCSFSTAFGLVQKSVVADAEFVAGARNRKEIADFLTHQIEVRSKECDRHEEFVKAQKERREHRNPQFLHDHPVDGRLFSSILRETIDADVGGGQP